VCPSKLTALPVRLGPEQFVLVCTIDDLRHSMSRTAKILAARHFESNLMNKSQSLLARCLISRHSALPLTVYNRLSQADAAHGVR